MNRQLVLKEVQLRLLLVRQSLMQGQYAEYQQGLDDVIKQLNQLPDYDSQQLKTFNEYEVSASHTKSETWCYDITGLRGQYETDFSCLYTG